MRSSWTMEAMKFPDRRTLLIVREATELLEEQERLLDLPMSPADMMLYEMRSQQIGELIQQLSSKNEVREFS